MKETKMKLPTEEAKKAMEAMMEKLHFVRWDRFTDDAGECYSVYGWIDRQGEAIKDFIVMEYYTNKHPYYRGFQYVSSSARFTNEIYRLMTDGEVDGSDHLKCQRVEDVFQVSNVIKLKK